MNKKLPLSLEDLKQYHRGISDYPPDAIWVILYRESHNRSPGQSPFHQMWEVFTTSDREEAWSVHRRFVSASNPHMTNKTLAVMYRLGHFGEGNYGQSS